MSDMRNGPFSMLLASTLLWTGTALSQSSGSDVHGRLRALADARPAIAHVSSIGTSFSGRDLWLLRIGSDDAHAPALWLDAAHDGRDAVGRETALRVAEHLLTTLPADSLDRLLNGSTLFVLPEASPDGRDTGLIPRPDDEDGDGLEDEDGPDDVDGDGRVVWMRVPDPAGEWVLDPGDPRTLVKRKPEDEGPFYRRYREGSDEDGDGLVNEDPRGGVSLLHNFPAGWEMPAFQPHAGPYSPSEAETIAILEQLVAHPEIGAVVTLGQGDRPEKPGAGTGGVASGDEDAYTLLDAHVKGVRGEGFRTDYESPGRAELGGAGQKLKPPVKNASAPASPRAVVPGSFLEWAYAQWGAFAMSPQLWRDAPADTSDAPEDTTQVEKDDEPRDERASAWTDWAETHRPEAFVAWHAVTHPTLGAVEVGGLDTDALRDAPPAVLDSLRDDAVALVSAFLADLPRVRLSDLRTEALSGGLYRVSAVVSNAGRLPTMSAQGVATRQFHPVAVDLEVGDGASLVDSPSRVLVGPLGAGDRRRVEWLVAGRSGTPASIRVTSVRAGRAAATIRLGEEGGAR